MDDLLLLMALVALVAYWFGSLSVRERAITRVRAVCQRNGVLLLDQTVALRRLRLRRDGAGQVRFQRSYKFEFLAGDGDIRRRGDIQLLGRKIEKIILELPDHTLHDSP